MKEDVQGVYVHNALELLNTPVWIWDLITERIIWANASAAALWGVNDLEQLLQMDFSDEPLNGEFRKMAERFRYGKTVEEEQVFSINGRPTTVTCQCQGIEISGYELTALVEVRQVSTGSMDINTQSSIEALQHTPAMVSLHRIDGYSIMRNPAAMRCFGFLEPNKPDKLQDRISDPVTIAIILGQLLTAIILEAILIEFLQLSLRQAVKTEYCVIRLEPGKHI